MPRPGDRGEGLREEGRTVGIAGCGPEPIQLVDILGFGGTEHGTDVPLM